jgi:hypothetical protein
MKVHLGELITQKLNSEPKRIVKIFFFEQNSIPFISIFQIRMILTNTCIKNVVFLRNVMVLKKMSVLA